MKRYTIGGVNGPVVTVCGRTALAYMEMVYVGKERLIGEVIRVGNDGTVIQVYEDTAMLRVGEPVEGTGETLSVTLGPGLLGSIFDGIERPLDVLYEKEGAFLRRGAAASAVDTGKAWPVTLTVSVGDEVTEGAVIAKVPETAALTHKILLPHGCDGRVEWVCGGGAHKVTDVIARTVDAHGEKHDVTMLTRQPIRSPRRVRRRLDADVPLVTGQRVIDTMFPLAKGGAAALPGGFGTGKTTVQHQIAKFCDADVIIYVGCGERGNEMTQVLQEFSALVDPRTGSPLLERTILIANTSNMPVCAREASIFTGVSLAEYYRDMGYDAALFADSTSRFAEALREISARLEEMPADEGYPAYLPSRLAQFYERAGRAETLCGAIGSVSIIGAVSPQGSDFSEPVTQNTKRFVRAFWALDRALAYSRHFPAVGWNDSYSEYASGLAAWQRENVSEDYPELREEALSLLRKESELIEIVKLVGEDVLSDERKAVLDAARVLRLGFLQQENFSDNDGYASPEKQYAMLAAILAYYHKLCEGVAAKVPFRALAAPGFADRLIRLKYGMERDDASKARELKEELTKAFDAVIREKGAKEA